VEIEEPSRRGFLMFSDWTMLNKRKARGSDFTSHTDKTHSFGSTSDKIEIMDSI
jgi:hypothetical protein